MDWPNTYFDLGSPASLYTTGQGSQAADVVKNAATSQAGANIGSNVVVYVPVINPVQKTLFGAVWLNAGTPSGNIDAGVMDADGNLIVHTGSTAGSGAGVIQTVSFGSSVTINPGLYYIAFTQDNGTSQVNQYGTSALLLRAVGVQSETTGSFGIPTTWTPTVPVAHVPLVGISAESVF